MLEEEDVVMSLLVVSRMVSSRQMSDVMIACGAFLVVVIGLSF